MSPRRMLVVLVAAAAALACAGCGGGDEPLPHQRLAIASGSQGGVYFGYGDGLARVVRRHLPALAARAVSTGGSVDSLRRVGDGRVDVGFTRADSARTSCRTADGHRRAGAAVRQLRADRRACRQQDKTIERPAQLRLTPLPGRDGQPRSGTQRLATRVLQAAGLAAPEAVRRVEGYDIEAAIDALVVCRVDAVFWAGGLPTPAIDAASKRIGVASRRSRRGRGAVAP